MLFLPTSGLTKFGQIVRSWRLGVRSPRTHRLSGDQITEPKYYFRMKSLPSAN